MPFPLCDAFQEQLLAPLDEHEICRDDVRMRRLEMLGYFLGLERPAEDVAIIFAKRRAGDECTLASVERRIRLLFDCHMLGGRAQELKPWLAVRVCEWDPVRHLLNVILWMQIIALDVWNIELVSDRFSEGAFARACDALR